LWQYTFSYLTKIRDVIPENVPIVSISKGIDEKTLELMCDIIPKALQRPTQPLAYLSGPSFAVRSLIPVF
jgi:glycerol-3-phosphate dehydrogenase